VTELTTDTLKEVIGSHDKVLVQYGASWCGNCRMVKPKFKKLASSTEGVEFVYVDAEKFPESRQLAEVSNFPAFA
jgi:thioredoxin 1